MRRALITTSQYRIVEMKIHVARFKMRRKRPEEYLLSVYALITRCQFGLG